MIWHIFGILFKNAIITFIPLFLIFRSYPVMLFLKNSTYSEQKLIVIQSLYISYVMMAASDIRKMFPDGGICVSVIMVAISIIILWYFVDKHINKIVMTAFFVYLLQILMDSTMRIITK